MGWSNFTVAGSSHPDADEEDINCGGAALDYSKKGIKDKSSGPINHQQHLMKVEHLESIRADNSYEMNRHKTAARR